MPFAFGHLIASWISGKIYEQFKRKKISHAAWFFLLLGSILPDIDYLFDWLLGTSVHRTFTHSLLFVMAGFLITFLLFKFLHHKEHSSFALAIAAGITTHLFLDFFSAKGIPLLWPSALYVSSMGLHYLSASAPTLLNAPIATLQHRIKIAILDMALGTAWLFYLWWKKKIQF